MRILLVCDRFPFPIDNGQNLRIYHYVRELRVRHDFDLACFGEGSVPGELRELFRHVEHVPRPTAPSAVSLIGRAVDSIKVSRMIADSDALRQRIASLTAARQYDLLWMSGWDTVTSLPRPLGIPLLADIVDEGVLEYWREFVHGGSLLGRMRTLKRLLMNAQFERRYFGPAQQCAVVSEVDAAMLRRLCPNTPVAVLPNGVDADFFRPSAEQEQPENLVFEGRMDFRPNVDGVLFFVREVLPLILERVPLARFSVVGKSPVEEVLALRGGPVEVTGFVDDVRPYLARAAVFVCPLRKGAGIKNKVLQAWSMGKAVVATPASVGGLLARDGENIVVADGAKAIASAVVDLLLNRERRRAIGRAARDTIVASYTWTRRAAALEALMFAASGNRRSTTDA